MLVQVDNEDSGANEATRKPGTSRLRSLFKEAKWTKWHPGASGATRDPGTGRLHSEILVQEDQVGSW